MHKLNKLLQTITFLVALNIFGVVVGALYNFHMHHIFHKALLPQDMVCNRSKQKYIYTTTNDDHGDGGSQALHSDGILLCDFAFHPLQLTCSLRLTSQQQEQFYTAYTGNCQSLRAPPLA